MYGDCLAFWVAGELAVFRCSKEISEGFSSRRPETPYAYICIRCQYGNTFCVLWFSSFPICPNKAHTQRRNYGANDHTHSPAAPSSHTCRF